MGQSELQFHARVSCNRRAGADAPESFGFSLHEIKLVGGAHPEVGRCHLVQQLAGDVGLGGTQFPVLPELVRTVPCHAREPGAPPAVATAGAVLQILGKLQGVVAAPGFFLTPGAA